MTHHQLVQSIKDRSLKLDKKGFRGHFEISLVCGLFFPILFFVVSIWKLIQKEIDLQGAVSVFISTTSVSLVLAVILYFIQKNRLKFKVICSNEISKEITKTALDKVAKRLEWKIITHKENYVIAKTRPSFLSGSFGEHITIICHDNFIMINSICDPYIIEPSLISMGRNRENENTLINEIKKALKNKTTPSTSQTQP